MIWFKHEADVKTYGRGYAWVLVAFFTTASVLLNGAHAVLGMAEASIWARSWAVLTAILFPLAVLAETHFLVNLIREWDMRARWIAVLRLVCIAAVLVVAYIAFVRSFYALGDMAALMGIPDEDWWMLPASIDAMIILATLGVVIAEGQMALDRDEAASAPAPVVVADPPVANESPTRPQWSITHPVVGDSPLGEVAITHTATAPVAVADHPVAAPPAMVADHPVVEPVATVADHPVVVADSEQPPQVSGAVAASTAATPAISQPVDQPATAPVVVADSPTDRVADSPTDSASTTGWLVADSPAEDVADSPSDRAPAAGPLVADSPTAGEPLATGALEAVAEAVHAETGTTKPLRAVVDVLRLAAEGESQRAIAAEVGIDRSLVRRWTQAADEHRRPKLVAAT